MRRGPGASERTVQNLNSLLLEGAKGATAGDLVRGSLATVDRFVGQTPPSDDITVMALRYRGPVP